jgi:hypothetical protein
MQDATARAWKQLLSVDCEDVLEVLVKSKVDVRRRNNE